MKPNVAIQMPEVTISRALNAIVRTIRDDLQYDTDKDKTNTILFQLLGLNADEKPVRMNAYNYFKQACRMFENPENMKVYIGYNMRVTTGIAMHIILPGEQFSSEPLGAGQDWNPDIADFEYSQFSDATYQILITSDNSNEAMVTYNVMKAMLLMFVPNLDIAGLMNPKLSGGDIIMQGDIVPPTIFHKALTLSFQYQLTVPSRIYAQAVKKLAYNYSVISDEKEF